MECINRTTITAFSFHVSSAIVKVLMINVIDDVPVSIVGNFGNFRHKSFFFNIFPVGFVIASNAFNGIQFYFRNLVFVVDE